MALGIRGRKRSFLMLGGLLIVAGLTAISALVVPSGSNRLANAQVSRVCNPDSFGLLCLRKDAPSRVPFTFDIQRDEAPRFTINELPCVDRVDDDGEFTEVVRGGDEVAIEFGCGILVRERQEPGWDLVDIHCQYEEDYYDVRREDDGIIILVDRTLEDSNLPTTAVDLRRDVLCTFVNRPERQPNLGGGLGGLFAGQPTPLPTARPAAAAPVATSPAITPPRTGDAGLQ